MLHTALLISNEYVDQLFGYVKEPMFYIFAALCVVGIAWSIIFRDKDEDPFKR